MLIKKAAAHVTVHVRLNPSAAWIVVSSVVASTLTAILSLRLPQLVADATSCLPWAASGTSPSLPAYEVCAVDVLQWALTIS
jgi:hypothetical protein